LQKITIFGLHGFFGASSDFDQIQKILPENYRLVAPDLFSNEDFDLTNFQTITDQIANAAIHKSEKKIFLGYSLGGRIGLHLLKSYPDLFDQWIFLSTHPGLSLQTEKELRLKSDVIWSEKLAHFSWGDFLSAWNDQAIFMNTYEPIRLEKDYKKAQLGKALLNLSLGQQADMSEAICGHQKKIKWVVGDRDSKFMALAKHLKQKKILENYSRISSGHRILFDANNQDLLKIILQPQELV
jgi:2-succinyl-6-hydroxy-2,4-cyclohexadiene-1-carboxylate synthase